MRTNVPCSRMLLGVYVGLLAMCGTAVAGAPFEDWEAIGPGAASVFGVVGNPTNERNMVAIIDTGDAVKGSMGTRCIETTDGGSSWTIRGDRLRNVSRVLAFDHRNIYLSPYLNGTNLLHTSDGGMTWDSFAFPVGAYWNAVCPHPTDSNTLYAAGKESMSNIFMFAASTNAGRSWTSTKFGNITNVYTVSALAVSKTDPRKIVACGTTSGTYPNKYVLVCSSSDGGSSWQDLSKSVSTSAVTDLSTVAIDPTDPNRIYLGGYDGLYTSADGGGSWRNTPNPGVRHLAIDPRDPRNLCAFYARRHPQYIEYSTGVYVSHDYGATWEIHTDGFRDSATSDRGQVWFMPANPSNIVVSTWVYGLTQSYDGGRLWARASCAGMKFKTLLTYGLAMAPSCPSRIMAGTDMGNFRTDNGGADWTELFVGGAGSSYLAFHPTDPNIVLSFGDS